MAQLPFSILIRSFLRTFVLQASWNFERLQSLGAVFVLAPALRFFYPEEARKQAFQRHLKYFNTHPFLAPAVLGTTLNLEGKHSLGNRTEVSSCDFRSMIMAPYAAIGDALFWGGLRPLASGVALFFAARGSLWAPVLFLTIFNIPHLVFQAAGYFQGYRLGLDLIASLQRRHLPDLAVRIKEVSVVLLGGLCAYLVFSVLKGNAWSPGWGLFLLPIVFLVGILGRRGFSILALVWSACAILMVLGWLV